MFMRPPEASTGARALAFLALAALSAAPAAAQQIKGPTTCFKCHKPQARTMWETDAPFHKKSVEQLSAPKAAAFATAIGLASPTTVTGKGDCVSCHATIVGGAPSVGVSCESCHGAASGYFTGHQEPEFFDQPPGSWMGLRNMFNDPKAIAQVCVDCHITPDARLKKAGHPAGETFDAGKGIAKMVHWSSDISVKRKRSAYGPALYAQVSAQAAPLAARRLASGGAATAAAVPPPAPKAGVAPPPAGAPPAAPVSAPAPRPRATAKAADPFDWDQPVAELPADYPGTAAVTSAPGATAPPPGAVAAPLSAPGAPSTAAELPPAPAAPALTPPVPSSSSVTATPAGPTPVTAPVPAVRGRAALLVTQLLKSKGAGQVLLPPPAAPREFDGPDGELLRLQDEILYLGLESLRKAQP